MVTRTSALKEENHVLAVLRKAREFADNRKSQQEVVVTDATINVLRNAAIPSECQPEDEDDTVSIVDEVESTF